MMWRYVGTILGVGLAIHSSMYDRQNVDGASDNVRFVYVVISCSLSLVWDKLIRSTQFENVYVSYSVCFAQNVVIPYVVIAVVPWLVYKVIRPKIVNKAK